MRRWSISRHPTYGLPTTNTADVPAKANQLANFPLNFLRAGYYTRSYGYINARTTGGYWWSSTASSATYGHHLDSWAGTVCAQYSNFRGVGFAVRCVAATDKEKRPIRGDFGGFRQPRSGFAQSYLYCSAETEQSQAFSQILA